MIYGTFTQADGMVVRGTQVYDPRKPRIITEFVQPPIPDADHWVAYDDRLGADASPYGYGATEAEAIVDLERQLEDALWR